MLALINCRKHEWVRKCKCCQTKDENKTKQEGIWED